MCAAQNVQLNVENGEFEVLFDEYPSDELIDLLKQNKPALVSFISTHNPKSLATRPIKKVARDGLLRLSYSQQRLWFLDHMGDNSVQNNISTAFSVDGLLSIEALQAALDKIIARHEILRTNYVESHGAAYQQIAEPEPAKVELVDISELNEATQQVKVRELVLSESKVRFDLNQSHKLRVIVIKQSKHSHVILFNSHLIAADGWSMNVMVKEFSQYYQEFLEKGSVVNQTLSIQYADYADWQREYFESDSFTEQLNYWQQNLEDIPLVHSLVLDKNRPAQQSFEGCKLRHTIDANMLGQLKALAGDKNVTLFMLLETSFALLIGRWSNEDDIVIGTPVAGRIRAEIEPMIGCFVNNLVLRTALPERASFSELLKVAKNNILNGFANQDIPFELLVDTVHPMRSLSHTPIFQIMFRLQNNEKTRLELPDAEVKSIMGADNLVKFDLELSASQEADGLELVWNFATSLFEKSTIERMAESYELLLQSIVADCEQDIYRLNMTSEAQLALIAKWNDNAAEFEQGQGMHELFMRTALKQPDAVAVTDIEGSISYEQLLRLSVSLAKQLVDQKVACEELVGVRLPKGRHQVVATMAIMMVGGAYLPMETGWPEQRCEGILQQASVRFMVVLDSKDGIDGFTQININEVNPLEGSLDSVAAAVPVTGCADKLAYVIFTSGSTGQPKGVAIEHGAVVNTLHDINRTYGMTSSDKALAVSALSFDLSVYDIFGILAVGGEVVYPEHEKGTDAEHWAELVEQHSITLFNAVPASADLLALTFERQGKASNTLRNILMSGDWISPSLPKRLWGVFPNCRTDSLGGATEASIWSISYPITEDTSHLKSVPYGKAMANQSFHILSREQQPVPIGVPGELYIGGKGVARCYYGDEKRSAASFFYHEGLGKNLYRTGDLGRYMADGNIEFIGRADDQVKILGFRVELGEIEAELAKLETVREVIVMALGDKQARRLVAYIIPTYKPAEADVAGFNKQLRQSIAKNLPVYMLPSAFVLLDAFPLTANSKVNKKALPDPGEMRAPQIVEPEGATEIKLAAIWSQVLELEKVSATANFFDLGGNSLQLTRLVYEIREGFDIEISIRDVFERTSLKDMAVYLENRQAEDSDVQQFEQVTRAEVDIGSFEIVL